MDGWQRGRMHWFAKPEGPSPGPTGSNPVPSAWIAWRLLAGRTSLES